MAAVSFEVGLGGGTADGARDGSRVEAGGTAEFIQIGAVTAAINTAADMAARARRGRNQ